MERCAYCGTLADVMERDHVPPKCLYPASKRAQSNLQLITVPACPACNRGFSDDEAHFRTVMLLAGDPPSDTVQELWHKAKRSFDQIDGLKRATEIWKMVQPVKVEGEDRFVIFPGDDERVLRVVRKIVRGLAHHHKLDTAIPDDRVRAHTLIYPLPAGLFQPANFMGTDEDICQYCFEQWPDDDIASVWLLKFFEKRIFIACIIRASSLDVRSEVEMQRQ